MNNTTRCFLHFVLPVGLWLQVQKHFATQLFLLISNSSFLFSLNKKDSSKINVEKTGLEWPYLKDSIDNRYLIKKVQGQKAYLHKQKLTET